MARRKRFPPTKPSTEWGPISEAPRGRQIVWMTCQGSGVGWATQAVWEERYQSWFSEFDGIISPTHYLVERPEVADKTADSLVHNTGDKHASA